MTTMTRSKTNNDNKDTKLQQLLSNPNTMKKTTEDASDESAEEGDDEEQQKQENTINDATVTSTRASNKRNADNEDDKPPQPSPNPKAKKKTKEDAISISSEDSSNDKEQEEPTSNNSSQVVDLITCFDREAIAGTALLWTQPIVPPTAQWKKVRIEGEMTGFSHEELWGEGETVHKLARLGKIIRELDARSSLTAIGWANLFDDSFRQKIPDATKTEQLKRFAVRLALSNPLYTFDKTAWFGSALRAREDTNAWTGAYLYFGAPWNMRKIEYFSLLSEVVLDRTTPKDNANIESDQVIDIESDQDTDMMDTLVEPVIPSAPAKVTPVALPVEPAKDNPSDKKANATKLVGFKTRNFFLSKPKTPPKAMPTNLPTALKRKFNTFFKIRVKIDRSCLLVDLL